jgi:RNA polymerase sigma factor (sigma-70 family)
MCTTHAYGIDRPGGSSTAPERLVRAAAQGDSGAWNELVERYSGLVWAVARAHRLSAADAADVAQTTWLRLVEHLERLKTPAAVGAWLATTARRECLHVLRQASRCQPSEAVPEPEAAERPDADTPLLLAERDATLWRAFTRLPARDQALLRLLTADPRPSYDEIGLALDMPIGSIGPTRARALERLRREAGRLGLEAAAA